MGNNDGRGRRAFIPKVDNLTFLFWNPSLKVKCALSKWANNKYLTRILVGRLQAIKMIKVTKIIKMK